MHFLKTSVFSFSMNAKYRASALSPLSTEPFDICTWWTITIINCNNCIIPLHWIKDYFHDLLSTYFNLRVLRTLKIWDFLWEGVSFFFENDTSIIITNKIQSMCISNIHRNVLALILKAIYIDIVTKTGCWGKWSGKGHISDCRTWIMIINLCHLFTKGKG